LEAVAACLQPTQGECADAIKPPLTVSFSNLRVGHVLVSDIQTMDGILIVAAGNQITPPLIQRLRNFSALSGIREPILVAA
jgi:hypothetical protein